jgi:ribosome maturation factor RimP
MIEPVVEGAGFELVDVVVTRGRPSWQVKVVIDTTHGDGRVPIDHCAVVSREIETNLDAADAIESSYRLEVSSPGLDRILAREKDFEAVLGSEIQLQTREPQDGRRKFRGELLGFEDDVARMDIDGCEVRIPFGSISRANVIYKFTRADFEQRSGTQ